MLRTIVEGEPGAFPEPVARLMRSIGGLFRRGRHDERPARDQPETDAPFDPSTLDPPRPADEQGDTR